jgi:hypothetical protein
MNLTLIANGLRMIADGLDAAEAPVVTKKTPRTTEPAPQVASEPEPTPSLYAVNPTPITTAPVAAEVSKQDVIDRFMHVAQTKGQDAVIALLKAHGLNRISEATPAQLAQLYAAAV